MSEPIEETTSWAHDDSTYEAAPTDSEHHVPEMQNPPPGPSVVQTRGTPVEAAPQEAPAKSAKAEKES